MCTVFRLPFLYHFLILILSAFLFACGGGENAIVKSNSNKQIAQSSKIANHIASVSGVRISSPHQTIMLGSVPVIVTIKTEVLPANASNKKVFYRSDKSSVATVNSQGIVTIKAAGSVKITAITEEGRFSDSIILNIQHTALPRIDMDMKDKEEISSKDKYVKGIFKLSGAQQNFSKKFKVRGRGNTTWTMPKKPYQLKFDKKTSVLGMPEDKKWILLANYSDKSMLRTELAFALSRLSQLDFTPASRFVELYINGSYKGVYQITQKVEESDYRVNIGKNGYLLEIDAKAHSDDITFKTQDRDNLNGRAYKVFNIKEPEVKKDDAQYNLIKNHIEAFEAALFGANFTDPTTGYAKYIDVASFVDWYWVNEISKNQDAQFQTSVYLSYIPGGKIKMGPVWDFDIAFGNINDRPEFNGSQNYKTDGFWIKRADWYARLFQDPAFVAEVKSRFNVFYNHRSLLADVIKLHSSYLDKGQKKNFIKWAILGKYVWPNYNWPNTYPEEVQRLQQWVDDRLTWLNQEVPKL